MSKKKSGSRDGVKIQGMFRIHIEEDGKIVGDSGWRENIIVNLGFLNFVNLLGTGLIGSKINAVALGSGAGPANNATVLPGEIMMDSANNSVKRPTVTAAAVGSTTLRNTATFNSTSSFITLATNISNIGLWNATGPVSTSGTLYAGTTYTSSSLATNQNVNVTYDIVFG